MRKNWLLKRKSIFISVLVFCRAYVVSTIITVLSLFGLLRRRMIISDQHYLVSTRVFAMAAARQKIKCYGFYLFNQWPLPWLQLTDDKHSFLFKGLPNQRLDEHLSVEYKKLPIRMWNQKLLSEYHQKSWRVYRVICVGYLLVAAAEISHRNTLYDVTGYVHPHTRALFERLATEIGWSLVSLVIITPTLGASFRKEPGVYLASISSLPPIEEHLNPDRGEPRDIAAALAAIYVEH